MTQRSFLALACSVGFFLNVHCFGGSFFDQYQAQAEALVNEMTLRQKVGQMMLPTFLFLTAEQGPNALAEAIAAWPVEMDLETLGEICGFQAITDNFVGGIYQDADLLRYTPDQSEANWVKLTDMANLFYNGPAGTVLLLSNDAVHGNQHVTGTALFPMNIGMGATHNPALLQRTAYWTMRGLLNSGFNWSHSPTLAIGHSALWGRYAESFSADLQVIKAMAENYVLGLQNIQGSTLNGAVATAKHFIADGDTKDGIDQGYSYARSLERCWAENGIGYEGAVDASVGSAMASYNSLNGIPMHFGGDFDILNQFRNVGIQGSDGQIYQLGGLVVSDYNGTATAAFKNNALNGENINFVQAIADSVNAGIDMFMIAAYAYENTYNTQSPVFYTSVAQVCDDLVEAVDLGLVSMARIDDAVTRILRTKLSMNTVRQPLSPTESAELIADSLLSAEQSLVLLQNNDNLIPMSSGSIENVFLMGIYDDIGSQNGGWTFSWQGKKGNQYWLPGSPEKISSNATSILDGMNAILGMGPTYYNGETAVLAADLTGVTANNSIAVIAIGEPPYAEYMGDVDNNNPLYEFGISTGANQYMSPDQAKDLGISFTAQQVQAIAYLKTANVPVVTVLFSGRPMLINQGAQAPLNNSDAFIAAFLPGTSGGLALANAIFGLYLFKSQQSVINGVTYNSNTLPFHWPANMQEVLRNQGTLFPMGYGLP